MIMRKHAIAAALMMSFGVSATASEVVLDQLSVRDHLYPANFQAELQNNLNFFRDGVGVDAQAKVPFDTVSIVEGKVKPHYYVNTTEIGLYLNILVEVEKAGNSKALTRILEVLDVLEETPTWEGLYFWPYDIVDGKLQPTKDGIVPAVDNANLALALAGVAGAYLESEQVEKQQVVARINALLDGQKKGWIKIYDEGRDLMHAGWSTKDDAALPYFIDRKANESRLAPLWAALITQDQGEDAIPTSAFDNMELYTHKYTFNGKEYNPMLTWDGAYFQAMLPAIWLDEKSLMPNYRMVEDMTFIQMAYAAKHNIPMVSSSATVDDAYAAFGVPHLSESKVKFNNEIHAGTTGTPHAVALSYMVNPETAVSALKALKAYYPNIESEFGWYDAVDGAGNMSTKILSLDQGMFVGAFLSDEINADVARYLEARGYMDEIKDMYQSYVPNNG
ncbi:hypothetical protein DZ860_09025 [Vibrio sinensis]|uniref:Glycoamylase-like domain-containing protein n=1 Tax=Vibrio sinensis TaxID=2302434 RepID=A0A3A6QH57_9VIBR|nr:glucoamylase family protein [Vibrio sinensis]RJX71963.1 hypothetical protein DZ860_09025 [Vibrio sinensis]